MKEFEVGGKERRVIVGSLLSPEIKESLVTFLRNNSDVFAWSHDDMPGINPSVISHRLNVDPNYRPVKQKRRSFAPERNQAIHEEVERLLKAGFIRKVDYPQWLANVVLVKKSSRKWRMCVDFTDLNKACPKELDLEFYPRTTIKAQVLTDFIAEFSNLPESQEMPDKEAWVAYVDGSSMKSRRGAEVALITPDKEEIAVALKLDFPTTNNEAEYEVVIASRSKKP